MNLNKPLLPGATIGIVGGGQLGRMMTISAKEMGFRVGILDPTKDCPAAQVADWQLVASYDDGIALKEMAKKSQVITYEFENVDVDALKQIEKICSIPQGTELLSITQDRLKEKSFLTDNDITIADYAVVASQADLEKALQKIDYPCVLKTTRGGYDGKGQYVLSSAEDIAPSLELLKSGICVLEAWVPFKKELSVLVTGNGLGEYTVFPVGENIHRHNILHETIVPARITADIVKAGQKIALAIAKSINLAGTLAVELFLTEDGELYVNELAPRPHNSGHYTIEACSMSQFDAHIRGVCGWPLAEIRLLSNAVMVNVLGDELGTTYKWISKKANWHFHYYGKAEAKTGRKMGHINILTNDVEEALEEVFQTKIWDE